MQNDQITLCCKMTKVSLYTNDLAHIIHNIFIYYFISLSCLQFIFVRGFLFLSYAKNEYLQGQLQYLKSGSKCKQGKNSIK